MRKAKTSVSASHVHTTPAGPLIKLLYALRLARTDKEANVLLLGIAVVNVLATVYIVVIFEII